MSTKEYNHSFITNSQGFRGIKEYPLVRTSDICRILVLGDSVALGHGVEDEETFSAVLEREWSEEKPIEVINMAVSGFGTAEELIQFRHVGVNYDPDLVIVAYFPNDPYNNAVSRLFRVENGKLVRDQDSFVPATYIRDRLYRIPMYSFLSQHSHLLNLVRIRASSFFQKKLGEKDQFETVVPEMMNTAQTTLTAALINELVMEISRRDTSIIILDIPMMGPDGFSSNFPKDKIIDHDGLYIVDVYKEVYEGHLDKRTYYKLDGHPTPYGHKLIGEWLVPFIREHMGDDCSSM
jgi:hypothetical protein